MATNGTSDDRPARTREPFMAGLRRKLAPPAPPQPAAGSTAARSAVRALRDTASEAQRSRIPQMAAALSYRTIFGLIPMLVVALVAVKQFFATPEDMARVLGDAMSYAGLSDISLESADPEFMGPPLPPDLAAPAPAGAESGAGAVSPPVPPVEPARSARLDRWITELVQRVGEVRWGTIGGIGMAMLIYAALAMLVEMERAFNQIYRVPVGRSWPRRITQYWTVLTLGTLGLVATFYVGEQFKAWAIEVAKTRGFTAGGGGMTVALIGYSVTVVISTLLFLLAYTTVPNTRVQFRAALAGALVAGLLWEAGKWGFTQYVRYSASDSYARLYGSIALVPLFLLWVYFTWLITLFGLQVSYQIQHVQRRTVATPTEEIEPVIVDPSAILSVAGLLAERFLSGEPVSARETAERLSIHEPIARRMLEQLVSAGIAHQVYRGAEERAYALARAPERIDAEQVLSIGEGLGGRAGLRSDADPTPAANTPEPKPPDPFTETLRRSRHDAVQGRSLASIVGLTGVLAAAAEVRGQPPQADALTIPLAPVDAPIEPAPHEGLRSARPIDAA
ncbi:MAG: YhjD/YihY/BrkB family envelope integrity protein [Phycisphaerales bacterium]